MGTRRSRHNKGRKPLYKEHRQIARHLIENPVYFNGGWYNTLTHWQEVDLLKLDVLCESDSDIEESADALGRKPSTLAHKAREQGLILPQQWAHLIYKPKKRVIKFKEPKVKLAYPYIQKPRPEHADLMAINALVPGGMPEHMRADICQEIMVAIMEGRTSIEDLKARKDNRQYFIKKFWRDNYEDGGMAISFNGVDDEWNSDAVASSIAAKEWRQDRMSETAKAVKNATRTYTPATQFEAAWIDQARRFHLRSHELGYFLSMEEIEEMMESESETA